MTLSDDTSQMTAWLCGKRKSHAMLLQTNATVVDNWLLEFACRLIDSRLDESYSFVDYYRGYYLTDKTKQPLFARDKLVALLHLLELIVVSDQLIYDADWSHNWMSSGGLKEIGGLLQPVECEGRSRKSNTAKNWGIDTKNDLPTIVRDGAMYYQELAQSLGVTYWPSPQRAEFLARKEYVRVGSSFVMQLRSHVDSALARLIDEAIRPLKLTRKTLALPGFGSTILASVTSRQSILSAALSLRESREAIGFRRWLSEMDLAFQTGDVDSLARALRDVEDVIVSIRATLGLHPKSDGLEFTIGLSPSIKSNLGSVRRLFTSFVPKKVHVTFLRRHFSRVLASADLWSQIERLFPEFASHGSSILRRPRPRNLRHPR